MKSRDNNNISSNNSSNGTSSNVTSSSSTKYVVSPPIQPHAQIPIHIPTTSLISTNINTTPLPTSNNSGGRHTYETRRVLRMFLHQD